MSRTQTERESSVFRKPTAPPPERAAARRGPETRGDRSLTIPPSIAASLSRTVREQLAYLTPTSSARSSGGIARRQSRR